MPSAPTSTEQWSSDANNAVQINLVRAGQVEPEVIHSFHPTFTYPIFGEEERIFGYKGLEIDIRFAAHDLRPNVSISYEKRFPPVGDTVALDLNSTLKRWLPKSAFTKPAEFEKSIQSDSAAKAFKPPGKLVESYSRKGRNYEIWAGSLLDPAIREILDRMQIFISFFIEAGTPLDTGDVDWTVERWMIYLVYEKLSEQNLHLLSPYSFVGYATTYRFYTFQPVNSTNQSTKLTSFPQAEHFSINKLPSRLRISQFLVLPPYQHKGHGSALYNAIYSQALADSTIQELTVEDPSEEFDILRDANDWKTLEPKFRAKNISINAGPFPATEKRWSRRLPTAKLLNMDTLKTIRSSTKIASRQFARQLEMYLLSLVPYSHRAAGGASLTKLLIYKARTPDPNDKAYYWWRLIVKQRIYKKNKDILQQMDLEERRPRVEESARAQEDEYERLLLLFSAQIAKEGLMNGNGTASPAAAPLPGRKRRIVEDDDDDEADEDEGTNGIPESKKAKV